MQDGVVGKRCLASKAQKELCFILKIIGMSNNARRVHRKLQKLIRLFLGVFVAKYACRFSRYNVREYDFAIKRIPNRKRLFVVDIILKKECDPHRSVEDVPHIELSAIENMSNALARPFLFCGLGGQNVLLNWLSFDVLSFPLFSWKDETPDIFSCECRVSHSFYNTTKDTQINNAIPLFSA